MTAGMVKRRALLYFVSVEESRSENLSWEDLKTSQLGYCVNQASGTRNILELSHAAQDPSTQCGAFSLLIMECR